MLKNQMQEGSAHSEAIAVIAQNLENLSSEEVLKELRRLGLPTLKELIQHAESVNTEAVYLAAMKELEGRTGK